MCRSMTLELLHVIRDLQGHQYQIMQDMKYALNKAIKNTESLTKSIQNTESVWQ